MNQFEETESDMTIAVVADTATVRRLGYRAMEEGWPSPSDKAFEELDPDVRHHGVLVAVQGWDGKFGSEVGPDALGLVSWALVLDHTDDRPIVHIGVPMDEVSKLDKVLINADAAEVLVEAARQYVDRLKFQVQAREELDRLLQGDLTDDVAADDDEEKP